MNVLGYNAQAAIRHFSESLIKIGFGRYMNHSNYRNGHAVLKPVDKNKPSLYVVFKRDFYMTFSKEFDDFCNEYPDFSGLGESINAEALERAVRYGCDYIIFIHPNEVLVSYPLLIKKFCESHGLIRCQKRLNLYLDTSSNAKYKGENEVTYSFPKKMIKSFEEEFRT